MPIDPDKLLSLKFPDTEKSYTQRDVMLYALGIGLGQNPIDPHELAFVYEKNLKVLPTFAVVLGFEPFLLRGTGITFEMTVHGEEHLTLHRPLATSGTIVARHIIDDVIDKGAGKGALLLMRRLIFDKTTGAPIATIRQSVFCRGDGGFGGSATGKPQPDAAIPHRSPDLVLTRPIPPQAALIYRLLADLNPLHADPEVAQAAGFPRPILHGLATFGVAGFALLAGLGGGDASALQELSCRFSAPVFPGETLQTDIWSDGGQTVFRCTAVERDKVVLDRGRAVFR